MADSPVDARILVDRTAEEATEPTAPPTPFEILLMAADDSIGPTVSSSGPLMAARVTSNVGK
jgi:hypothetical protein